MTESEGAVRKRRVPDEFRKARVTNEEILAWAREQLNGQEADLRQDVIGKIKSGEITEVVLRPRKPGFFLPDGSFVEAFDYSPEFGDDLDEAEKKWAEEEKDRRWVEGENGLFNKSTAETHPRFGQLLWEHGKRIEIYGNDNARSVARLLRLLDRFKPPEGYARHTHQTALDFYRWLPDLTAADSVLDWKWERIDAVLRFSNSNAVRNHLRTVLDGSPLGKMRDDQLSRLLGIKTRGPDMLLSADDRRLLEDLRGALRRIELPDQSLIRDSMLAISRVAASTAASKPAPMNEIP